MMCPFVLNSVRFGARPERPPRAVLSLSSEKNPSPTRRRVLLAQYWWEDRVLRGVARYAVEQNWILDCRMRWIHAMPQIAGWRGDGIIAYLGVAHPMAELVDFVRAAGVPVVETQAPVAHAGGALVIVPHETVGATAAEHLLALEFQQLRFVLFEENPIERLRCTGFAHAVRSAGREFREVAFRELPQHLAGLTEPTGVMTSNDTNALEVIRVCLEAGLRVPEQVAVVGVDDADIVCDLAPVPLTSVNCNYERQGYAAAALLDRLMAGEPPPSTPIFIPPAGVTVRRSTDTIAMPDSAAMRALRFLRDHFREPIGMADVQRAAGTSLRRIQKIFREHAGRTLSEELARLRLAHAQRLLADPKAKIDAIARESGYTSRFHFVRAFRRATGISPKAYRARRHGSPPS
jgi:LacI family transcriptional regulator